jgi:L-lactate dehydrogenase complex protein LldE
MYSFHISDACCSSSKGEQVMKVMRVYPAKPADVYLYATCLVDLFDPVAGLDAIALLEREGIRVHFVEKQTCCGQPAYTSGHEEEARQVAQSQMALFPSPGRWWCCRAPAAA